MPGHLIEANFSCGFSRSLSPGHDTDMAYTEREDDINTFSSEEIERRKLKLVPNPFLGDPINRRKSTLFLRQNNRHRDRISVPNADALPCSCVSEAIGINRRRS